MALRLALSAVFSFTFSFPAQARIMPAERQFIEKVVEANNRSKTAAEFVANSKGLLHPKLLEQFAKKAAEAGNAPLPKLKFSGDDTLVTYDQRVSIPFKVIDAKAGQFTLNGKFLDFSKMKTLEEVFAAMEKAMPDLGADNAWFDFLVPRAHANIFIAIYFIAAAVAGVGAYDISICSDLHDAIDGCYKQKSSIVNYVAKMNKKILDEEKDKPAPKGKKKSAKKKKTKGEDEDEDEDEDLKNFKELKALRKKGQCLPFAVNDELDGEIHDAFGAIRKMEQHPASEFVMCYTGKKFPSESKSGRNRAATACQNISILDGPDHCSYTWIYWPDVGAGDRVDLLRRCSKSLYEMSKDVCMKRATDLYELHNPEEMQRPPSGTTR